MLKKIRLRNIRSYSQIELECYEGLHALVGPNGSGKTNLIESICFALSGRSFRTDSWKDLLLEGTTEASIEALISLEEVEHSLRIEFFGGKKRFFLNSTSHQSFTPLFGLLPLVTLTPTDADLLSGSPKIRRRFLNLQLSQADPSYGRHLVRYTKALLHKNQLLKQRQPQWIPYFEQEMTKSGCYLIEKRKELIEQLSVLIEERQKILSSQKEQVSLVYKPSYPQHFPKKEEEQRGETIVGPHRDDFTIYIEGKEGKRFASEGQKRSFIAALKLSEWEALQHRTGKTPLLLIDDFGAHLDDERQTLFIALLKESTQTFITSPRIKGKYTFEIRKGSLYPL